MGTRIQHVSVSRPPGSDDAARHFYGELLGLEEIEPPRSLADRDLIWYQLDSTELHLLVEESIGQDHSGRHFCIAVENVEALRERLEAEASQWWARHRFRAGRATSSAIRSAT